MTEAIAPQSAHAWTNDGAWHRSLEAAALRVESCLPAKFHDLHGTLVRRARSAGARALILSGSTARGRRTDVSDLDYHLIGPGVETRVGLWASGLVSAMTLIVAARHRPRRAVSGRCPGAAERLYPGRR